MAKLTRQDIYDTAKELSNWGRWGEDDQIGTLNNVTPDDVIAAGRLIKKGKTFGLGLDLKEKIQSGLFGGRWNMIHQMLATGTDAVTGEQDGMEKPTCATRMMRSTYRVRAVRSGTPCATSSLMTRCTMDFQRRMLR